MRTQRPYVIAREHNVVRVDFRRQPDPPAPKFPGAAAQRRMAQMTDDTFTIKPKAGAATTTKFALVIAGILAMPHITPAIADQKTVSLVKRADWRERDFAAYLPAPPYQPPWLNLDFREKLPKGDVPLGRQADSFGHLALKPVRETQMSLNSNAGSAIQ